MVCTEFFNATESQITVHGLIVLAESLPPESLSVLFRNNHFSVLYKKGGGVSGIGQELFTLVTDIGYKADAHVVWETLSTIEGDSLFYDGFMKKYQSETQGFFGSLLGKSNEGEAEYDEDRE